MYSISNLRIHSEEEFNSFISSLNQFEEPVYLSNNEQIVASYDIFKILSLSSAGKCFVAGIETHDIEILDKFRQEMEKYKEENIIEI